MGVRAPGRRCPGDLVSYADVPALRGARVDRVGRPCAWTRSLCAADHLGARPVPGSNGPRFAAFRLAGFRRSASPRSIRNGRRRSFWRRCRERAGSSGRVIASTRAPRGCLDRSSWPSRRSVFAPSFDRRFRTAGARWRFLRWQIGNLARAPLSPTRMAQRAAVIASARSARRLRPRHRADADRDRRAGPRSGRIGRRHARVPAV